MKENKQRTWIISKLKEYFEKTSNTAVGVRRLHYWIVSLPENNRMVSGKSTPGHGRGKKNECRPYRNDQNDYQNICSAHIADARILGEIPWECIIDEKNEQIYAGPEPVQGKIDIYSYIPDIDIPNVDEIKLLPEFNNTINTIFKPHIVEPKFTHQKYHLVIIIEKATSRQMLQNLADKHGTSLQIFTGQSSVTRINDAVDIAKKEFTDCDFYISDLDIAGLNMPKACIKNLNQIYPNENILIKVGLTREQAKDLPSAFDADFKDYSQKQKDEFIQETGSKDCVELDALSESQIFKLLDDALSTYSGLDQDEKELKDLQNIDVNIPHIEHHRDNYEKLKEIGDHIGIKINKKYADCQLKEFFESLIPEIQEYKRIKSLIEGN